MHNRSARDSWSLARRLVLLMPLLVPAPSEAATLRVPTPQHPTLRGAIAVASDGDTVLVAEGIYTGYGFVGITLAERDLVIRSEGGAAHTVLHGDLSDGPCFMFCAGLSRASVLEGFTLTGLRSDGDGGALAIVNSSPTISHCVIVGNRSAGLHNGNGGGIACMYNSSPLITDCTISGNVSVTDGSPPVGGVWAKGGATPVLTRCIVWGNQERDIGISSGGLFTVSCCCLDSTRLPGFGVVFEGESSFEDPLLCHQHPPHLFVGDPADYMLWSDSPCLPWNSPCSELIGPLWVGCPESEARNPEVPAGNASLTVEGNPMGPRLRFSIHLATWQDVRVSLHDVTGAQVVGLGRERLAPGHHQRGWTPRGVSSGVYYLNLRTEDGRCARRIVIMR